MGSVDKVRARELLTTLGVAIRDTNVAVPGHRHAFVEAIEIAAAALREQPEARGVVDAETALDAFDRACLNNKRVSWHGYTRNDRIKVMARFLTALTAAQQPGQEGGGARLTNPWTGEPRDYRDVNSDPAGTLCVERGAPLKAAPPSAPVGVEDKARAMFEAQADKLAAPWERQWAPTKDFWRKCAAEALSQQPAQAAPGEFVVIDGRSYALDTVRTALLGLAADVAATLPGDDAAGGGHG